MSPIARPSLLLLAALAACQAPAPAPAPALPVDAPVPEATPDLLRHRPVLSFKAGASGEDVARSQEDGERDLFVLSVTAPAEDGWYFRVEHGVGWWRNIGTRESPVHVSLDFQFTPDAQRASRIAFYHLHTGGRFLPALAAQHATWTARGGTADGFWDEVRARWRHLASPPPSLSDFRTAASLLAIAEMLGLAPVESKVVTPLGIWTYGVEPRLRGMLADSPERARKLWQELAAGGPSREEWMERLRRAGFEIRFDPAPHDPWALLRARFERYLAEARER